MNALARVAIYMTRYSVEKNFDSIGVVTQRTSTCLSVLISTNKNKFSPRTPIFFFTRAIFFIPENFSLPKNMADHTDSASDTPESDCDSHEATASTNCTNVDEFGIQLPQRIELHQFLQFRCAHNYTSMEGRSEPWELWVDPARAPTHNSDGSAPWKPRWKCTVCQHFVQPVPVSHVRGTGYYECAPCHAHWTLKDARSDVLSTCRYCAQKSAPVAIASGKLVRAWVADYIKYHDKRRRAALERQHAVLEAARAQDAREQEHRQQQQRVLKVAEWLRSMEREETDSSLKRCEFCGCATKSTTFHRRCGDKGHFGSPEKVFACRNCAENTRRMDCSECREQRAHELHADRSGRCEWRA